ncbi:DUF3089 domain-containing protein [Phenylobacterium sp.]|jgi:hypothetical protein|uniref:DUF3089 domain-containing protein n=1 Tax=Phenylobacterium sp. TaxID=1871053 RepID=UPI002F95C568
MGEPAAPRRTRWWALAIVGLALVLGLATGVFWGDLRRTALDPKVPFQTYRPPPAPDYTSRAAWALMPTRPDQPARGDPPVDVFFVGPTTYDGGRHWNAPIDDGRSDELFREIIAPNYAGPFVRVGRIFAPRYRQASLYTLLTLREDAREARAFAYRDVAAAFRTYLSRYNRGRPFIVVGVEQGGTLATRLLAEEVPGMTDTRRRLVAAYLMGAVVPADAPPLPPCTSRPASGCLAAWAGVPFGERERGRIILQRALVWGPGGELVNLGARPALCFNPILGAVTEEPAPPRLHQGAANATGLEWGARPAFMARQVSARCEAGVLHVSKPKSASLQPTGSWEDRRKMPGYNLFYADLEADAQRRVEAWRKAGRGS